jgi:hypothetical protein
VSVADPDEDKVATYLAERNLVVDRFPKEEQRNGKTPDFRVSANGEVVAYCEVKSIVRDTWLDRLFAKVAPDQTAGGLRNDPVFNRLTDDIHKAVQQFDAVNPGCHLPNVLGV